MDPQAVIDRYNDAVEAGDWQEAKQCFLDLFEWRKKGGFIPEGWQQRLRPLVHFESVDPLVLGLQAFYEITVVWFGIYALLQESTS